MLRKKNGFTLVEILVVTAIIAILAFVAIPRFSAYKKDAVEAKVKSSLALCMLELVAQRATEGGKERNCTVADAVPQQVLLQLDAHAKVMDTTLVFTDVNNYGVTCTIEANQVNCTAS